MTIFDETVAATRFDPFAPGPKTAFEDWGDLIPAPSLATMVETLAQGNKLDITHEWEMASAALTLRYIAARDDTATMSRIELEEVLDGGEAEAGVHGEPQGPTV